jgi:hypothetical protein
MLAGNSVPERIHTAAVPDRSTHRVHDPQDHRAALRQLDPSNASHIAARSGDWSDPRTWASSAPTARARVLIPPGVTVNVTGAVPAAVLEWIRIEGALHFSSTADSQLSVSTLLVAPSGTLSIGSPEHAVAPENTVRLSFLPRPAAVRRQDSFDMLGGLIAFGHMSVYGAPKTAFATALTRLGPGASELTFATPPAGWKTGDELLVPGTDTASEDERRRIASISSDRKTVTLSSPLMFGHTPPTDGSADVPVANLSRNVIFASTDTSALHQRAHVMVMTHQPVHIFGAAFRGLGRTNVSRPHTLPTVNAAGEVSAGDNPIGRYAVHFHLVSGASRSVAPHVFTDNVIVDSPKHGLVNHGGYVVAEDNVTFDIPGSHFFAENGSEIGAFRHNLAVFSRGSGEHIEARQPGLGDFGHGGHGFWSNSPALAMERNYAFHHAGSAYVIFAVPVEMADGTQNVFFGGGGYIANFLRDNLDSPIRETVTTPQVTPTAIPFRFSRNTAAHSGRGLEVWHANEVSGHDVHSIVEDCAFWALRSAGIAITYGVNTVVRNSIVLGSGSTRCDQNTCDGYAGITTEGTTRNISIEHVRVAGFRTGVRIPSRGTTRVSNSYFDNTFNILLEPPHQPGRKTIVADNAFAPHQDGGEDYHFVTGRGLFHGDVSMLFERDSLIVTDSRFPGKSVYRYGQHPTAVPFRDSAIPEFDGKTAEHIQREYGLAIGGVLAPYDAEHITGIADLVGGAPMQTAEMADEERMLAHTAGLQAGTGESYATSVEQGYGTDCCNIHRIIKGKDGEPTGWRVLTEQAGDRTVSRLVYVDTRPPRFTLDPRIRLRIHPDDVKYGVLIQGTLYDEGSAPEIVRRTYDKLAVGDDGYVNVPFEYPDRAGNVFRKTYRLAVTRRAARRASDLFHDVRAGSGEHTSRYLRAWMLVPLLRPLLSL